MGQWVVEFIFALLYECVPAGLLAWIYHGYVLHRPPRVGRTGLRGWSGLLRAAVLLVALMCLLQVAFLPSVVVRLQLPVRPTLNAFVLAFFLLFCVGLVLCRAIAKSRLSASGTTPGSKEPECRQQP